MKARVVRAFYDVNDPARKVYQIGSFFEGERERIEDLVRKGYVVTAKKAAPKKRDKVD